MTFYWRISLPCEDHYWIWFVEIKLSLQSGTRWFTTVHRLDVMSEQWETRLRTSFCSCTYTYEFVLIVLVLCFVMLCAPIWRNIAHKKDETVIAECSLCCWQPLPTKAAMGNLLRNEAQRIWTFGGAYIPYCTELKGGLGLTDLQVVVDHLLVQSGAAWCPKRVALVLDHGVWYLVLLTLLLIVCCGQVKHTMKCPQWFDRSKHINTSTNLIWLTVHVVRHLLVDEHWTTKAGLRKAGFLTIHERCNDVLI